VGPTNFLRPDAARCGTDVNSTDDGDKRKKARSKEEGEVRVGGSSDLTRGRGGEGARGYGRRGRDAGRWIGRTVYLANSVLKAGLVYRFVSMVQDVNVMHVPPPIDFDIVGSIELSTIKLSLNHHFPLCLDN